MGPSGVHTWPGPCWCITCFLGELAALGSADLQLSGGFTETYTSRWESHDPELEEASGCEVFYTTQMRYTCGERSTFKPIQGASSHFGLGPQETILWRINCTNMQDSKDGKRGTFLVHVGSPSFTKSWFSCGLLHYRLWCHPNGETSCRDQWRRSSAVSGVVTKTGDVEEMYLISGQLLDVKCILMPLRIPKSAWIDELSLQPSKDPGERASLKVATVFVAVGVKMLLEPSMGRSRDLLTQVGFHARAASPASCYKDMKHAMALRASTAPRLANSLQVQWSYEQTHKWSLAACASCVSEELVRCGTLAPATLSNARISSVGIDPKLEHLSSQALLQSAVMGVPHLQASVEGSTFPTYIIVADIIVDPSRLPNGTKEVTVTVEWEAGENGGERLAGTFPVVGATGSGIMRCSLEGLGSPSGPGLYAVAVVALLLSNLGTLALLALKRRAQINAARHGTELRGFS